MKNRLEQYPQRLLLLTTFLIPFYFFRFSILSIPTNVFEIAVLATLVAFTAVRIIPGQKIIWRSLWPCLFLASAFVSILFAADTAAALGIFKGWFLVPAVYWWLIINIVPKGKFRFLSWPLFASLMVVSVWALLQRFGVIGLLFYQTADPASFAQYQVGMIRVFGPSESPNYLAMFLAPAMFLSLPILSSFTKKNSYTLASILFALPVLALFFSLSRGGFIAFIFSLLIGIVILRINERFKAAPLIRYLIASSPVLAFIIYFVVSQNFGLISDSARLDIYRYAWEMIKSHPIAGIGLGDFHTVIRNLSSGDQAFQSYTLRYALHPHNLYLAVWLNLGLFGAIAFAGILVGFFKRISKLTLFYEVVGVMAMAAILIHGLVDTTYFKNDLAAIFWLAVALPYISRNEQEA